jgi:hypothetical protein
MFIIKPVSSLLLFSISSTQSLSAMLCLMGRKGTRMGYCLSFIVPWMLRYVMSWMQTLSLQIHLVASFVLSSSSRLLELRLRTALNSILMFLGLLSASIVDSTLRAMSLVV